MHLHNELRVPRPQLVPGHTAFPTPRWPRRILGPAPNSLASISRRLAAVAFPQAVKQSTINNHQAINNQTINHQTNRSQTNNQTNKQIIQPGSINQSNFKRSKPGPNILYKSNNSYKQPITTSWGPGMRLGPRVRWGLLLLFS